MWANFAEVAKEICQLVRAVELLKHHKNVITKSKN
jgi:hypothetical protein